VPRSVKAAFGRLRAEVGDELDDEVLSRVMVAWTAMFGTISFLLFGHLHGMVEDHDDYFAHEMSRIARYAVTGA
jgi:hypothetical protein